MNTYIVKFRHRYDKLEEIEVEAEDEARAYSIACDMTVMELDPSDAMWFDSNMEEVVEV